MSKPVDLREDFDADALRRLARRSRDAGQSRRLLALAAIYEGESRTQAARIGAVGLRTVRDLVLAFNAAGPDGLIERKKPGPRPKLDDAQRQLFYTKGSQAVSLALPSQNERRTMCEW